MNQPQTVHRKAPGNKNLGHSVLKGSHLNKEGFAKLSTSFCLLSARYHSKSPFILQVIIAGAGGAAHLPGMVASMTPLPVVGVPVKPSGSHLDGIDALLSIVQVLPTPV